MPMPTLRLFLRPHKTKGSLAVMYSHASDAKPLSLEISVTNADNFSPKPKQLGKYLSKAEPQADAKNASISNKIKEIADWYEDYNKETGEYPMPLVVQQWWNAPDIKTSLPDIWEDYIKDGASKKVLKGGVVRPYLSESRVKQLKVSVKYVQAMLGNRPISVIDGKFGGQLYTFASTHTLKRMRPISNPDAPIEFYTRIDKEFKQLNHNSIVQILVALRAVLDFARGKGLCKITDSDFEQWPMSFRDSDSIHLDADEFRRFCDYEPESKEMERIKINYEFQCWTGMRFGDKKNHNWEIADGLLKKLSQKTGKPMFIPLPDEAKAILAKYPEPWWWELSNGDFNTGLKEYAGLAGLKRKITLVYGVKGFKQGEVVKLCDVISSHSAKHYFINMAHAAGVDIDVIGEWTGTDPKTIRKDYLHIGLGALESAKGKIKEYQKLRITHKATA